MPAGIPVATVAINNSKNAALLAIQILSLFNENIRKKLILFKKEQHDNVINNNLKLKKNGVKKYLEDFQKKYL